MKTNHSFLKSLSLVVLSTLFIVAGTDLISADPHDNYNHHKDKHHNNHAAWSRDHNGYWDNHNSYHTYTTYNHHRGYWRPNTTGVMLFINID